MCKYVKDINFIIEEYQKEYQNRDIKKGLKVLEELSEDTKIQHFYALFRVAQDDKTRFNRYLFYQIPYSEWDKLKKSDTIKDIIHNNKDESEWRYPLVAVAARDKKFDKINSILAHDRHYFMEFDRIRFLLKILEQKDVGNKVISEIRKKLIEFFETERPPKDYPDNLWKLEKEIIYQKISDNKNVDFSIWPLFFKGLWFGLLLFFIDSKNSSSIDKIKDTLKLILPILQEKIFSMVVEKRFLREPLSDIDGWTIEQLSMLAATQGLTKMDMKPEELKICFRKSTDTKSIINQRNLLGNVKIESEKYKVFFNNSDLNFKQKYSINITEIQNFSDIVNKSKEALLRIAISTIMSRNMSHNLGSHVLINLEGNRAENDDLKQFIKYSRIRMDFVAQIATDWPCWSIPTRFFQDLIYEFLNQQCLLEYIGASEKLYENHLKFRFYIVDPSNSEREINSISEVQDSNIWLSILGGTTGRHAFYVILENIIRNAAKHSYTGEGNLEINVRLKEERDKYRVEIWDNVSKDQGHLIETIQRFIKDPLIIAKTGELLKGNWGIAEMKIASAFLQKKSPTFLGKKGELNFKLLQAEGEKINGEKYLKYIFYLPKPKEIAIFDFGPRYQNNNSLKNESIYISSTQLSDFHNLIQEKHVLDYELLVIIPPENKEDKKKILKILQENRVQNLEKLPSRLLWVGNKTDFNVNNIIQKNSYLKKRIAILRLDEFNNKFDKINKNSSDFKLWLYTKWIVHLRDNVREEKINGEKFYLYLKLTENEGKKPYISKYLKNNYTFFIPPLIENSLDKVPKNWDRIKQLIINSPLNEIIKDILIHETIPQNDIPIIAYSRHGKDKDQRLNSIENKQRIIYAENLSGASPHFNLLALPPDDNYQLQKLALSLIEGGLLKVAIVDERIGNEIGNSLQDLNILNIAEIKRDNRTKPLEISDRGEKILFSANGKEGLKIYEKKETEEDINWALVSMINRLMMNSNEGSFDSKESGGSTDKGAFECKDFYVDILVIHQGVLDKLMKKPALWKNKEELEKWFLKLKEKIPFIIVTSGRGRPEKVPSNVKFIPFSDIKQSFLSEHSTKFLLTYIVMNARE